MNTAKIVQKNGERTDREDYNYQEARYTLPVLATWLIRSIAGKWTHPGLWPGHPPPMGELPTSPKQAIMVVEPNTQLESPTT